MPCCTLLTLTLAALTIAAIVRIPTTPSAQELMRMQKRQQQLKMKAGTYKPIR